MFLLVSPFTSYLDGPKRSASRVNKAFEFSVLLLRRLSREGKRSIAIYVPSSVTLRHWSAKKTRSFLGRKLISSPPSFPYSTISQLYREEEACQQQQCHYNSDDSFLAYKEGRSVLHTVCSFVHYLILINWENQFGLPAALSSLRTVLLKPFMILFCGLKILSNSIRL